MKFEKMRRKKNIINQICHHFIILKWIFHILPNIGGGEGAHKSDIAQLLIIGQKTQSRMKTCANQ